MKIKLYAVKPEWTYGEDQKTKRAEQLAVLERFGLAETPDLGKVICGAEQAIALVGAGYCGNYFGPDHLEPVYEADFSAGVAEFVGIAIEKSVQAVAAIFNEKTQQEQPGPALMGVTETMLMEDACTDALQERIADGWRILAVCPQPQRRPDYVLGRATPVLAKSALRG